MSLKTWVPAKQLQCSVPVNADNYNSQLCGWQTAIDDLTHQAGILIENLEYLMKNCRDNDHKDCSCEIRGNQITVLRDFFGLEVR